MAKTTTVNPRGRDGRFKKGHRRARRSNPRHRRRRRHNYGAAASNPRRRRRRSHAVRHYYGSRRRRRNPGISPYSSGGYRRAPNPGMFDFDELMEVVPAATGGVMLSRWALKQSGQWDAAKDGTLEPGLKQAIAVWVAAHLGSQLVESVTGDSHKGMVARIAALGFGGDLFARLRFFKDSDWLKNNVSLAGPEYDDAIDGFQQQSALGAVWEDATGNRWTQDGQGNWVLAGFGQHEGPLVQAADGTIYQLSGGMGLDSTPGSGARLDGFRGFQSNSVLGFPTRARSSVQSSFGYSTGD